MRSFRLAELAGRLLRDHGARGGGAPFDRAEAVAALQAALQARARRRRRLRYLLPAAAAAVVLSAVGLRFSKVEPRPVTAVVISTSDTSFIRAGVDSRHAQSEPVYAGDRLRTSHSTARVAFSTGTDLGLGRASEMEVLELGARQRLALRAGKLHAHVSKLRAGEEFSITTPDALVSVRGTEFEVEVTPTPACGETGASSVRVLEGVVVVREGEQEHRLTPGQSWRSPCATSAPEVAPVEPREAPSTLPVPTASAVPRRVAAAPAVAAPTPTTSSLAEQNDLFARALSAQRAGNQTTTVRLLDDLLSRFPDGPLAGAASRVRREAATTLP